MAEFKNTNERVKEVINNVEHEFNSNDTNHEIVIGELFNLQSLTVSKLTDLQNESLSSVIFWLQESQALRMKSYRKIAKKLFEALKNELSNMDFRSAWEMPIEA